MSSPPNPQDIMAAAQAAITQATQSLNDSQAGFGSHSHDAGDILAQIQRNRATHLVRSVMDQVRLAQLQPGLPATEVVIDPVTHFSRQVWRRRNAV